MCRSKNADRAMRLGLFVSALVGLPVATSLALITVDPVANDVSPSNPATWISGTNAYIGKTADGKLTVDGGSQISSYWNSLGYYFGSTGTVMVDGAGSTWDAGVFLYVGHGGLGMLNITNGGKVRSSGYSYVGSTSGSAGTVNIDGAGSTWEIGNIFNVGLSGSGTLNVTNGGTVKSIYSSIGLETGSSGIVNIDGAGSIWNILDYLHISGNIGSHGGSGKLNVTNGGIVSTKNLCASLSDLHGNGTINTYGAVLDADLVFDSTHGLTQTLRFGSGGILNLTINGQGELGVGYKSTGNLYIKNGRIVSSAQGYIGYSSGSTGTAMVDGGESAWNVSGTFQVGYSGFGTLDITNGGVVNSNSDCIGFHTGSIGTVTVNGEKSTWNNGSIYVGGYYGSGTLNIINGGKVVTRGSEYSISSIGFYFGSTGTVNIDGEKSTWNTNNNLYVGYHKGSYGTLNITNSGTITSSSSTYLGYNSGSTGTVNVDGAGSTWNAGFFCVGCSGSGTLNITNGGTVNSGNSSIGLASGSTGTATVAGAGSKWTTSGSLYVGNKDSCGGGGTGILNINCGSVVTAKSVSISSESLLSLDIGFGSTLNINNGTGTLTNNGTVRFTAGASVAAGEYQPILAGTFTGSGIYQALGGRWDNTHHVFIVDAAETGNIHDSINLDLTASRRAAITDATSGQALVGASFLSGSGIISFAADELTGSEESALFLMLTDGSDLLAGYQFTVTGTTIDSTNPVYLSLFVGRDYDEDTFKLWHYDGTAWTAFLPTDLSYDGLFASFTVTGFSGYAISGELIPEPASLGLLAISSVGLLMRRRR